MNSVGKFEYFTVHFEEKLWQKYHPTSTDFGINSIDTSIRPPLLIGLIPRILPNKLGYTDLI